MRHYRRINLYPVGGKSPVPRSYAADATGREEMFYSLPGSREVAH
jgi:hypothetical protein